MYLFFRMILWIIGILVSLYPALFATGSTSWTWPPLSIARAVNAHGEFKDVLYVIVTTAVLELSVVMNFFLKEANVSDRNTRYLLASLFVLNFVALGSSLVGFTVLSSAQVVPEARLPQILNLVYAGAAIGLVTEVIMACSET